MNNPILTKIHEERNGHYCHALEVESANEFEGIIENVIEAYPEYKEEDYIEFFETMEIYALNDDNEKEIFEFSFRSFIKGTV